MKLFWCPNTRASRVVWMLEEAGVAYDRVLVDIREPDAARDPEFAAASPMGKVPALADADVRMADSAAICIYLADRYPACGLAPPVDDPARGAYLWWMLFTPAVMEPALSERFRGAEPNRFSSGWGDFDAMVETLHEALSEGPWLLGPKFSAADVMVGSSVLFMQEFNVIPDSDRLKAYAARCATRPAYAAAMALDD
ncbi:MAG: glutathione S-transferase family protein [Gammaproteobacteria bacterium]|nr:glutathione S-transferase family protein [Gammaproteobacteria bacterium]